MLARTYRLTDKLGIALLKSSVAVGNIALLGTNMVVRVARRGFGTSGVLGAVFAVLLFFYRRIVLGIWRVLRAIFVFIGGIVLFVLNRILGVSVSTGSAMAQRRAARAELEAGLAEDPLRAQNRLLSGITVVLLAALIGVVLWATNPARQSALPPADVAGDTSFTFNGADTPAPGTALPVASLSTVVPTATALPSILDVQGSLAYVVRENAQDDIWALPVGSRTPIRLTNNPADERDPVWSPDGRKLAYASHQGNNWDLYIYDLPTNSTTRMTYDQSFQGAPSWSPDGKWLAYESYQGNNLDIYVTPIDASQPAQRVTDSPAPDFAPAWSPLGRQIAFVSWRDGNQDIYVFSLDTREFTNLTNTPDRQEDHPAWSPDGKFIAYSAVDQGKPKVFVKAVDNPQAAAQVLALGREPAWSPKGSSLVFAVDSLENTQFVAAPFTENGLTTAIIPVPLGASHPTWTGTPLPAALVNAGGVGPAVTQPLYVEQVGAVDKDGLYKLANLDSVKAPAAVLSDKVNDSFNALRRRTSQEVGWDFLGNLEDAFWGLDRPPQPGEERRNWYMTGRQFGINRNLNQGFPARIEVVREDNEFNTFWRVYVRAADDAQSGQIGEPLRRMPWDMLSRTSGDVAAYDAGGKLKTQVPSGYYIDFTQLAHDYGWDWVPAGTDWRANINSINYWLFRRTDGLDWYAAMRELYLDSQLGGFAPTAAPQAEATQPPG
jgi:TolB protein